MTFASRKEKPPWRSLVRILCAATLAFLAAGIFVDEGLGDDRVVVLPEETRKVCQLTGEWDRQCGEPTVNRTFSGCALYGTDLGASFEHEGRLLFLFGDTVGLGMVNADSMAWSADTNPDDCVELCFASYPSGKYRPPRVPGVSLGVFEVPMEGVSHDGCIYVYFTTDHSTQHTMGRSVVARSCDEGRSFTYMGDISTSRFINLSIVTVDNGAIEGLPEDEGRGMLIWGSGEYRYSDVYLAWMPLNLIEDPATIRYFAGTAGPRGAPIWSASEEDARTLFDQPCVGELSASWNPFLERWLLLYNCHLTGGVTYRAARAPWGPWSEDDLLFHPDLDDGYCHFIHRSWAEEVCDLVSDPFRWFDDGGVYGPYLIDRYSKGIEGEQTTIYYTLSTWNPYNVVLMRSTLAIE